MVVVHRNFISYYRVGTRKIRYRQEFSAVVFSPFPIPQAAFDEMDAALRRIVRAAGAYLKDFTVGKEQINRIVGKNERIEAWWHIAFRRELVSHGTIVLSEKFFEVNVRPRFGREVEKIPIGQRIVERFRTRLREEVF